MDCENVQKKKSKKKKRKSKVQDKGGRIPSSYTSNSQNSNREKQKEVSDVNKEEMCCGGAGTEDNIRDDFVASIVDNVIFDSSDISLQKIKKHSQDLPESISSGSHNSSKLPNKISFNSSDDCSVTNQKLVNDPLGRRTDNSKKEDELRSSEMIEESFTDPAIIYQLKPLTQDPPRILMTQVQPLNHLPEYGNDGNENDCNLADQGVSIDMAIATSGLQQILRISPEPDGHTNHQNTSDSQTPSKSSTLSHCCIAIEPHVSGIIETDGQTMSNVLTDAELDGRGSVEYDNDSMTNLCTSHISELTDGQDIRESITQLVTERSHIYDIDYIGDNGDGEAHLDPVQDMRDIDLASQNGVFSVTEGHLEGGGEAPVDISVEELQDMENNLPLCSQNITSVDLRGDEEDTRCCANSNDVDAQIDNELSKSHVNTGIHNRDGGVPSRLTESSDGTQTNLPGETREIPVVISSTIEEEIGNIDETI